MALSNNKTLSFIFSKESSRSAKVLSDRKIAYSITKVYNELLSKDQNFQLIFKELSTILQAQGMSVKTAKKILLGLIRFAFLCQPVNEPVTTTIVQHRWDMDSSDSRFSSLDNCITIFNHFYFKIKAMISHKTNRELSSLVLYTNKSPYPYGIPLDYKSLKRGKIHTLENIILYKAEVYENLWKKRLLLHNAVDPLLPKKIKDKILVCSYKTERRLTGNFKSNREYRWETVARSPQGANKKSCWKVEIKLLEQILRMEKFPKNKLTNEACNLLSFQPKTLCPIMLKPLNFNDLTEEDQNTVHGESKMQLGHLDPKSSKIGNHTENNISWISKEGNRIQGNHSVKEIHREIISLSQRILNQN